MMSVTWDEIETARRRERNARVWRVVVVVVVAVFAWHYFFVPSERETVSPQPEHPGSEMLAPSVPMPDEAILEDSDKTVRKIEEPTAELQPPLEQVALRSSDKPREVEDNWTNELAQATRSDVIAQFERLQRELNAYLPLDEVGGREWTSAKELLNHSSRIQDDVQSLSLVERAFEILSTSVPVFQRRKLDAEMERAVPTEVPHLLHKFRIAYPNHRDGPKLESMMRSIHSETWIQLAEEHAKNAPASDQGLAEAWLAISDVWQQAESIDAAQLAFINARDALQSMTHVERAVESGLEVVHRMRADALAARSTIDVVSNLSNSVSGLANRRIYLAELSGLAAQHGFLDVAERFQEQACSTANLNGSFVEDYWPALRRCQAMSFSSDSAEILEACRKLPKYNGSRGYSPLYAHAGCYSYAAEAAARNGSVRDFAKSMLLAESQLASLDHRSSPAYVYLHRLAEADLSMRRLHSAVVAANQIPNPAIRASILFRVITADPNIEVASDQRDVFMSFGTQRWGCSALARYVESQVQGGYDAIELYQWIVSLPQISQVAAGFCGLARAAAASDSSNSSKLDESSLAVVESMNQRPHFSAIRDWTSAEQVLTAAESEIAMIQDPLEGAYAWLQIAGSWHSMNRIISYNRAVAHAKEQLLQTWRGVWEDQPDPVQSVDGTFSFGHTDYRTRKRALVEMESIAEFQRSLAQMQVAKGDGLGALQSLLDLARTAGFQADSPGSTQRSYLFMKSLILAHPFAHLDSPVYGIDADWLEVPTFRESSYADALVAAWCGDIAKLETCIAQLENRAKYGQLARAYAELAILHAEKGDVDAYKNARRMVISLINSQQASQEVQWVLSEADSIAGEYALAEQSLAAGTLEWYGNADKPRARLAICLAESGRVADAVAQATLIKNTASLQYVLAWNAVARAKRSAPNSGDQITQWVSDLELPIQRVSALCGIAQNALP